MKKRYTFKRAFCYSDTFENLFGEWESIIDINLKEVETYAHRGYCLYGEFVNGGSAAIVPKNGLLIDKTVCDKEHIFKYVCPSGLFNIDIFIELE